MIGRLPGFVFDSALGSPTRWEERLEYINMYLSEIYLDVNANLNAATRIGSAVKPCDGNGSGCCQTDDRGLLVPSQF